MTFSAGHIGQAHFLRTEDQDDGSQKHLYRVTLIHKVKLFDPNRQFHPDNPIVFDDQYYFEILPLFDNEILFLAGGGGRARFKPGAELKNIVENQDDIPRVNFKDMLQNIMRLKNDHVVDVKPGQIVTVKLDQYDNEKNNKVYAGEIGVVLDFDSVPIDGDED